MKIFFIRPLPWVTAGVALIAGFWQWRHPLSYPWPLIFFLSWDVLAIVLLTWRRLSWREVVEKMLPSFLVLCALALGFLIAQSGAERWILSLLLVGISYLLLELLFLLLYAPARYPVNGLSRLNIALIPIAAFFLTAVFNGLFIFLYPPGEDGRTSFHLPWWVGVGGLTLLGALFFFFTAHPSATRAHRWRWGSLGGILGLHLGILTLLLPVALAVHGAIAAILTALLLRIRRYAHQPIPPRKLAWFEALGIAAVFVGILGTSRWM